MAMSAVAYAKDRGLIVELSGEDASRADPGVHPDGLCGGLEWGADRLCFCDTVGLLTPERVAGSSLPSALPRSPSIAMMTSAWAWQIPLPP